MLCSYCKDLVRDMFRLQREIKTVRNVIVRTFKNSENNDVDEELSDTDSKPNTLVQEIGRPIRTKTNGLESIEQEHCSKKKKKGKIIKRDKDCNGRTKELLNNIIYAGLRQNGESNKAETEVEKCNEEENDNVPDDETVYNIEALIDMKDATYLVKWENYPDAENTWEPKYSIPDHILEASRN